MADKIVSKKLNMTLKQMENEIIIMRKFEQYMRKGFGEEYNRVCMDFARELTASEWDKVDPDFAEQIRDGLLDVALEDASEVLS